MAMDNYGQYTHTHTHTHGTVMILLHLKKEKKSALMEQTAAKRDGKFFDAFDVT